MSGADACKQGKSHRSARELNIITKDEQITLLPYSILILDLFTNACSTV